jgi:predicted patatin/cPLA2 family phospholipase
MKDLRLGITFAGGGAKSFYQLGLMCRWRELLLPHVGLLSTCSAGSFVASIWLSEREENVGQFYREKYSGQLKNFDWRRLLSGRTPALHEDIYRDLLLTTFAGGGFERIRSRPFPVLILTTAFPAGMPSLIAMPFGYFSYNLRSMKRTRKFYPAFNRVTGIKPMVFDARRSVSAQELSDLIIASSATPPFTAAGRFENKCLLDGGIIDHVPSFLSFESPGITHHLVIRVDKTVDKRADKGADKNSEDHPAGAGKRLLLAPSEKVNVKSWDFTKPDLVEALIRQGENDADLYHPLLMEFLSGE